MTDEDKTYLLKELTRTLDESDSTAAFCLCQRWILKDALAMLKEQEESIPVSWLKEKLVGHPEIPYATTDGIIDILDMWEWRLKCE